MSQFCLSPVNVSVVSLSLSLARSRSLSLSLRRSFRRVSCQCVKACLLPWCIFVFRYQDKRQEIRAELARSTSSVDIGTLALRLERRLTPRQSEHLELPGQSPDEPPGSL